MTDDLSGQTLSHKFVLQRRIGVGGMATVYEAINTQLDKRVAIKILKREYFAHSTLLQRFEREARHAAKMNHPHMVHVTDYYVDDGTPFIVMEYLEGCTLSELQHSLDAPLPWRRVVDMCAQVCSALQYAHGQGLLHRDIKPSNVFLLANPGGEGDHVKLLDFGIAKLVHLEPNDPNPLTSPSQIPGTPEYMAPEQAKGEDCEARTDLYSLGVMMYRLLTGRLPFYGATPTETLTQHVLRAPTPPSVAVPHVEIPPALESIVLKTLAKLPEQRWDSARAMREALLSLLDDAEESTRVHRVRRSTPSTQPTYELSNPAWVMHAFEWRYRLLARRRLAATFAGVSLALCTFIFLSLFPMPGVATLAGTEAPPEEPSVLAPPPRPPPLLMPNSPKRAALRPPLPAEPPAPPPADTIILDDPPNNPPPTPVPAADEPIVLPRDTPVAPPLTDGPGTPPATDPVVEPPPRIRTPPSPRRQITSFLKRSRAAFRKCSDKLPLGLAVTIPVDLTIEPSTGRALDAVLVDNAHRTLSYATCALAVLKILKYPRFVGDGQLKAIELELKP